jgi:hypothetical protein
MSRIDAVLATIILLAGCSHQTLPGDGNGGGGSAGNSAGAGGTGGPGPGGSGGSPAGTGGTAGAAGATGTGGKGGVEACNTPNPAEACRTSANACLPSTCKCSGGNWACTRDCGGGRTCSADAGARCPPTCFRAVRCVTACGGPAVSHGCCPCVPPAFDDISCPRTAAFESFLYTLSGGPCPPNSDCSSSTELLASGLLRHDCMGQLPVAVHEALVPAADRDAVIAVLIDPALVALLAQSGPPCQPPTDVFEGMTLMSGGMIHKNSVTLCQQPPISSARSALQKLVAKYLPAKCPKQP